MAEGSTTLSKFTGRVLTKLGIIDAQDRLKLKIKNELNIQVAELVEKIKKEEKFDSFYTKEVPVSFVGFLFNMRTLSDFESYRGLRETTWGNLDKVDWEELENLKTNANYDDEYRCAEYDKQIKLFIGRNINATGATFYLKYSRLHIPVVSQSDIIDVPDSFIEQLINSVYAVMQATLKTDMSKEKG